MSSGTEGSTSGSEVPSIRDGKDASPSLDIIIWFDFVRQYYGSPAHMQATTVIGLHWYKYAEGVEHEYVLATVLRQDQKIYLRLERRASDEAFVDEKTVVKEETLRVKFYSSFTQKPALSADLGHFSHSLRKIVPK